MSLIIDGHNLIPKIPGLSLQDIDDEIKLIHLLQEFSRIRRVKVECYFDKAPMGFERERRYGTVIVKFAHSGENADQEILKRLRQLNRSARNYTVVSSDRQVQAAARAYRTNVVSAELFARQLMQTLRMSSKANELNAEVELSSDEVERWLKVFGKDVNEE